MKVGEKLSEQGWISIYRQLRDNPIYKDKPYDRTHAWLDLLLSANHEEGKTLIGNNLIIVCRGSFITSEVKLADKWGWSRKKVRVFLSYLESDQMLTKKGTSKYTSITIGNYGLYQDLGPAKEQQKNIKRTSKEHQKNTNNNDNNDNNKNNVNNYIYSDFSSNENVIETIREFIEMRNLIKKPLSERALKIILNKLNTLAETDDKKILVLEQSIANNWQGVFELKQPNVSSYKPKEVKNDSGKRQYDVNALEKKLLGRDKP